MGVNTHFYHFSRRLGIFVGHTRGIRGVFVGYTYVSGMCRECIGYVSVTCRNKRRAKKKKKCIFLEKNLVMSGDFCTFAGESVKQGD